MVIIKIIFSILLVLPLIWLCWYLYRMCADYVNSTARKNRNPRK